MSFRRSSRLHIPSHRPNLRNPNPRLDPSPNGKHLIILFKNQATTSMIQKYQRSNFSIQRALLPEPPLLPVNREMMRFSSDALRPEKQKTEDGHPNEIINCHTIHCASMVFEALGGYQTLGSGGRCYPQRMWFSNSWIKWKMLSPRMY
ncbi:hypothetical protein J5N97_018731 [Dioscorea zingiberensis]|uniref:Uncharacterized protein n=1 Tax=Dioscorea zingiberensis TaxID=325984 RepID=A0A9D5HC13_9LILI|nr:hypothetical protein J5N97_018731 [Dioscorea zingiberensis]